MSSCYSRRGISCHYPHPQYIVYKLGITPWVPVEGEERHRGVEVMPRIRRHLGWKLPVVGARPGAGVYLNQDGRNAGSG